MRKAIMFAMMLALASPAAAQSPAYRFRHGDNPVADADAYLLTLVAADPRMRAAVAADPDLKALGQRLTASRDAVPRIARLVLSVAPLVKTISRGTAPITPATRSRAASTASRASRPISCVVLPALP